jgi:hypothetical protein
MEPQDLPNYAAEAGRLIDLLGGLKACAAFFEVRLSSVYDWRVSGIPRARLRHLRDVRPEWFAVQAAADAAATADATSS